MGMDAYIFINEVSYDAYKGRYVYYYRRSDDDPMDDPMEICYDAEGGYGRTICLIKIGYTNGITKEEVLYSYYPYKNRYGVGAKFIIPDMSDVLIIRVVVFSPCYGYKEKFNKKFQKELSLYKSIKAENTQDDDISNETETEKQRIEKQWRNFFNNCDHRDLPNNIVHVNGAEDDNDANKMIAIIKENVGISIY